MYVHHLDLTGLTKIKERSNEYFFDEQISSEMCQKILPRIHNHVDRFTLEPNFMKHILASGNYPQLYFFLSLRNFQEEVLHQYFTGMFIMMFFYSFSKILRSPSSLSMLKMIRIYVVFANNLHIFILILQKWNRSTIRR